MTKYILAAFSTVQLYAEQLVGQLHRYLSASSTSNRGKSAQTPVYLKLVNMMLEHDLSVCPDRAACVQGSMWSSCTGTWGSRAT